MNGQSGRIESLLIIGACSGRTAGLNGTLSCFGALSDKPKSPLPLRLDCAEALPKTRTRNKIDAVEPFDGYDPF
jgi:hypothetical protein